VSQGVYELPYDSERQYAASLIQVAALVEKVSALRSRTTTMCCRGRQSGRNPADLQTVRSNRNPRRHLQTVSRVHDHVASLWRFLPARALELNQIHWEESSGPKAKLPRQPRPTELWQSALARQQAPLSPTINLQVKSGHGTGD